LKGSTGPDDEADPVCDGVRVSRPPPPQRTGGTLDAGEEALGGGHWVVQSRRRGAAAEGGLKDLEGGDPLRGGRDPRFIASPPPPTKGLQ